MFLCYGVPSRAEACERGWLWWELIEEQLNVLHVSEEAASGTRFRLKAPKVTFRTSCLLTPLLLSLLQWLLQLPASSTVFTVKLWFKPPVV